MKKRVLALTVLAAAVCLSVLFGTGVLNASAEEPRTSAELMNTAYFANVNRSVEIKEEIIGNYLLGLEVHNGKEFSVYSDDYAGVFIDEQGILNVAVVGELHNKPQLTARNGGQVIYHQFVFSYNYLQKTMNAIEDIMDDYSINTVGIDDLYNHVFVELNKESDISEIIEYLQKECLYNETALEFIVDPRTQVQNTSNTAYGGESLFRYIDPPGTYHRRLSRGTITAQAICNKTGQLGVLTNEHVARANQTPPPDMLYGGHWNGSTNGEEIETGNGLRGQNGGTVDAAFVPFANQQNWNSTPHARYDATTYTNIRLGNNSQIIQGQPVMKIGQTTGVTNGKITSANISSTIDDITKTNTFRFDNSAGGAASANGDSGGPVYFDDGTNRYLIGMVFGGYDNGTRAFACRISEVMKVLDVTPITNDRAPIPLTFTKQSDAGFTFHNRNPFAVTVTYNTRKCFEWDAEAFDGLNHLVTKTVPAKTGDTDGVLPVTITNNGTANYIAAGISFMGANYGAYRMVSYADARTDCTSPSFNTVSDANGVFTTSVLSASAVAITGVKFLLGGTVDVPQKILGFSGLLLAYRDVTQISDSAFAGQGMTKINLPNQLQTIGGGAFANCAQLSEIIFPASVTSIGNRAFQFCYNLSDVDLSATSITKIEDYTFDTNAIQSIRFPGTLQALGEGAFIRAFHKEGTLSELTLPSGISSIGAYAFADNSRLSSLRVERPLALGITTLGFNAFRNCTALSRIVVPDPISAEAYQKSADWEGYGLEFSSYGQFTFRQMYNSADAAIGGSWDGVGKVTITLTIYDWAGNPDSEVVFYEIRTYNPSEPPLYEGRYGDKYHDIIRVEAAGMTILVLFNTKSTGANVYIGVPNLEENGPPRPYPQYPWITGTVNLG